MKKHALIILILFLYNVNINAQIILDQIVDSSYAGHDVFMGDNFYTTELSSTETKYVFLDDATNTFSLYNMDFSPFILNISLPEPVATATSGYQPIYITRALFDCDTSNIEYAYQSPTICTRTFYVMRIDGTVLFQLDSANGPFCLGTCLGMSDYTRPIRNTSAGTKLFLQHCSEINGGYYIYSLCGTLPLETFEFSNSTMPLIKFFLILLQAA
jgi:hypothetical protein